MILETSGRSSRAVCRIFNLKPDCGRAGCGETGLGLEETLEQVAREMILRVLERHQYNLAKSADELKITRHALRYRMNRLSIVPPREHLVGRRGCLRDLMEKYEWHHCFIGTVECVGWTYAGQGFRQDRWHAGSRHLIDRRGAVGVGVHSGDLGQERLAPFQTTSAPSQSVRARFHTAQGNCQWLARAPSSSERRQRRDHRGRNPTLEETGGLPPMRSESSSTPPL
jgi:hypothetical protein